MATVQQKLGNERRLQIASGPAPGALDWDSTLRTMVTEAISRTGRSREQIADEMTFLTGRNITALMLNAWTADSKDQHRFPLAFLPAFCKATESYTLITHLAEMFELKVASAEQLELAALAERLIEKERTQRELDAVIARRAK